MGNCIGFEISCDKVFDGFENYVVKNATYKSKLKKDVDTLGTELNRLIELRNDVKREVDRAEQQPDVQRSHQVGGWFSRVEAAETNGNQLLQVGSQEIENLCFGGCCSKNCKSNNYGEDVTMLLQQVADLRAESDNFRELAGNVLEDTVDEKPTEDPIGQQSMLEKVWKCLIEEHVRIIGICGMGGVGKTMLLKQINDRFRETHNGFFVKLVVVSRDLPLEMLQEKIMRKIDTIDETWKDKSTEDKADDISMILSRKKFVLLLDDVWKRVDLTEVGVPPKVKIVFTTRSSDVCSHLDAQRRFKVECLRHEEAMALFRSKLGHDHPLRSDSLAEDVARECKGLPLALITVGRAMAKKKRYQQWINAVEVLQKSAHKFEGMDKEVFLRLKFSYDCLADEKCKPCLLYCSLFPEDYKISKKTLVDCWIGEGILENGNDEARNKGYEIIDALVDAYLLEEEQDDRVKMHDVIRDMALWIAKEVEKKNENFFVETGVALPTVPEIGESKEVRRISLMENQIEILEETLICPNLLTLFLNINHLKIISNNFFESMSSLRVLNLSANPLTKLPPGISKLSALQHLDLSKTDIEELPTELEALKKLKCLNLEYTTQLRRVPRKLISKFPMLSVLRIKDCGSQSQQEEDSALFNDGEFLIEELLALGNLDVLTISLKSPHALETFLSSSKLQSCAQSLCYQSPHHTYQSLRHTESIQVSLADMRNLETLDILDCKYLEEFRIDCAARVTKMKTPHGFHSLQVIIIRSCSRLNDLTWLILAPILRRIVISDCSAMVEIIRDGKLGDEFQQLVGNKNPLSKLEFLELQDLQNLQSIYWSALKFPCLKEIKVNKCPKLKKLPLDSNSAKENKIVIMGHNNWWEELQWDDPDTKNAFRPCFKDLW